MPIICWIVYVLNLAYVHTGIVSRHDYNKDRGEGGGGDGDNDGEDAKNEERINKLANFQVCISTLGCIKSMFLFHYRCAFCLELTIFCPN